MTKPEEFFLLVWDEPNGFQTIMLERTAGQMPTDKLRGLHAQLTPLLREFMNEVARIRKGEPSE